jgi:hypothetical protein
MMAQPIRPDASVQRRGPSPRPSGILHPSDIPIPPELQARDWIFRDPSSYRAGVREALAWMAASSDHVRIVPGRSIPEPAPPSAHPTPRPATPQPARTGS